MNRQRPNTSPPSAPSWLRAEAKKEFRRCLDILKEEGRDVSKLDLGVLVIWSEAFVRYREASRELDETGFQMFSEKGGAYLSPVVNYLSIQRKSLLDASVRLGFSPADRAKIVGQAGDSEDNPLLREALKRNAKNGSKG